MIPRQSILDAAGLPLEQLAELARREASRPRPVYGAHRWFARRFGTAMRALLVGAVTPEDGDFDTAFLEGACLDGLSVLDPFVGGGTIVYEASRLGASVTGIDVDQVACAVTRFELAADRFASPEAGLDEIWRAVGKTQAELYRTDNDRVGLHYFWVQQVGCARCDRTVDAHPNHLLGLTPHKTAWTVCPDCGNVQEQDVDRRTVRCGCGHRAKVDSGPVARGALTCPHCRHTEPLVEAGRRLGRPTWKMLAVESIRADHGSRVPIAERTFAAPSKLDLRLFEEAVECLDPLRARLPRRPIPTANRSDDRIVHYGYRRYIELFNDRQLLHLTRTAQAIRRLEPEQRTMLGLALSNHTVSNSMLTTYTAKWRQATPLFAVRSFRHTPRPVELNPWVAGIGRGTLPNAVRRVAAAVTYARQPTEFTADGYQASPSSTAERTSTVINGDSRAITTIPSRSVDLVVTDPPYFDNIAYSELSDFFVPWLAECGLTDRSTTAMRLSLAATNRSGAAADTFADGLTACLTEAARCVKANGRVVFTFQHSRPAAWIALAAALRGAGLNVTTVFPLKGDGDRGLHHYDGTTTWDAVFVAAPGRVRTGTPTLAGDEHIAAIESEVEQWATRLKLGAADRRMQRMAMMCAATAGYPAPQRRGRRVPLIDIIGR